MAKVNWTFQHLKSQLEQYQEIKDWIVIEENVQRRERYFLSENSHLAIDQDRNVQSKAISLRLFVKLAQEGRQGEVTKKLFQFLPLKEQIEMAIEEARQTDHQAWQITPQIPTKIPDRQMSDPQLVEDINQVMDNMTSRIALAVQKERPTTFNSAELFLSVHQKELHLSNGLNHRSTATRIYLESAFSFSKNNKQKQMESDEYLSSQWAVHQDQLSIEKLFDETSERSENSLNVTKPISSKYSVIIDAEVLSTLLHGQITHLSAINAYHGLPFSKPGSEFIPNATADLLSITLDPTLSFGANTASISDQGTIQTPLVLVEDNRVVATSTDKQYGDYLAAQPSTVRGNIVVNLGKLSYEELTQSEPQVIEILQFSGLFTDSNTGTFSSEIRLARLYDNKNKKTSYLKGGSLSGSISENFRGLRLSNLSTHKAHFSSDSPYGQGYFGPQFALLSNVSIVG